MMHALIVQVAQLMQR